MIEVLTTGALNTVQDLGRPGHLSVGVGRGGAMDRLALQVANVLLANPRGAAGLELAYFPLRLRSDCDVEVAVTGADCDLQVGGATYPGWWAFRLPAGEVLTIGKPRSGARAYVAFGGGIDVPLVLGSRATDAKSGFGGVNGGGLARNTTLALFSPDDHGTLPPGGLGPWLDPDLYHWTPEGPGTAIRILKAAEFDAFTAEAREAFFAREWQLTPDANRQGYRLQGEALHLSEQLELLSHGIVPGTIQVPRSGQPIIQLADANTCGGYPKIATVIEADLPRLAQYGVGARFRFVETTVDEAVLALRRQESAIAHLEEAVSRARRSARTYRA